MQLCIFHYFFWVYLLKLHFTCLIMQFELYQIWNTDMQHREMMPEQFNLIHWRTGELPLLEWTTEGASGCFFMLEILLSNFSRNLKPLSACTENLDAFHTIILSSKRRQWWREGGGRGVGVAVGLQEIWIPMGSFPNPNRVQNINIPRNLLFPYIICLLNKKTEIFFFNVWLQWQRVGAKSSLDGFLSHSLSENS